MKSATIALIFFVTLLLLLSGAFFLGQWFKQVNKPLIEQKIYNNFVFTKQEEQWTTTWQNNNKTYLLQLRYFPTEVELVPMTGELNLSVFNKKNITIVFDPNKLENYNYVALAAGELGLSLKRALGREPTFTCTTNETQAEVCKTIPPVTCETTTEAVILLNPQGPAEITLQQNCIILSGSDLELLRSSDKLLYIWYGIMHR